MSGEKKKAGAPSTYSDEIAERICSRIAKGESLKSICRDPEMPCENTVFNWLEKKEHDAFLRQYVRAREQQADALADECLLISDDAIGGSHEAIAAARLRVDTRKWLAGKLRPKKYNDKLIVEGNSESPLHVEGELRIVGVDPDGTRDTS